MEYGLNLFSIRSLLDDENKLTNTILKLKQIGYSFVQFSGMPFDSQMLQRVVKNTEVPVVLTHVPYDFIVNDTEKAVEQHLSFGCKNIGLGMPKTELCETEKDWKCFIDTLQKTAEKIKKVGCKFFYHNHYFEFYKFSNGQRVLDYMINNAPDLNFTIDSYWVQYGGCNPENYADKIKGRIDCVHLKDFKIVRKTDENWNFSIEVAPLGEGNLDFNAIIENWKKNGAKYFLVEQDNASMAPDPLEQVKISIDYLKKLKF